MAFSKAQGTSVVNACITEANRPIVTNAAAVNLPNIQLSWVGQGVFIGAPGNQAIFVTNPMVANNTNTVIYQGIALRDNLRNGLAMDVVGVIVHEMGHAYAHHGQGLVNNEVNACIFEIDVLLRWGNNVNNPLGLYNMSAADFRAYFGNRDNNYTQVRNVANKPNVQLANLQNQAQNF